IFNGHSDLMAERKQEAEFGRGKPAAFGGAEEQYAARLFLGLQADPHNRAQILADRKLPETPESLLAFQSGPGSVAPQIAENHNAAQARNHIHEMIVQTFFLGDGAEIFRQAEGDDGSWSLGMSVMQEKHTGRHAHY